MLEFNQVYHGDCLEVMNQIDDKSIDMILCDLPYGTTACKWDTIIPFEPLWKHYKRIIKDNGAIVLTCKQPFTSLLVCSNLKMFKYEWIWHKTKPSDFLNAKNKPMPNHENITVFSKGNTANGTKNKMVYIPQMKIGKPYKKQDKKDKRVGAWDKGTRTPFELRLNINFGERYPNTIILFANDNHNSLHPTQKPVKLFEYLIKTYTNENDLVLDNCAGSGTTGIAARNLNRNFILIEKELEYVELIQRRLNEPYQKKLFIQDKK